MTVDPNSIDLSAFMAEHLQRAEPDLLRSMLATFVQALMSAEADAICGAPYGERSAERTNSRNGYRTATSDLSPEVRAVQVRAAGGGPGVLWRTPVAELEVLVHGRRGPAATRPARRRP